MVTTKAENYRAKARQCEEMARLIGDRRAKEDLLRIAHDLVDMAERLEHDNTDVLGPEDSIPNSRPDSETPTARN